jgi:hypothetical protein
MVLNIQVIQNHKTYGGGHHMVLNDLNGAT